MLYGVDVHARYQSGLDIPLLADQGYSFLVTKASQGTFIPSVTGFSADQFRARYLSWLAQTRDAGMIPGLYHWIVRDNAAAQAKFFYGLVKEAGGPGGMLIQLDCEDDATLTDVKTWAAEWQQLSGGHPFLLYTGGWWWGPRGWDGASITPYLWDSHYLSADTDTIADDPAVFAARIPADWWTPGYGGWPSATILQFTSRGDAGSLGNNVDLNATKLSRAQLLALTGGDMISKDELGTIAAYDVLESGYPTKTTNPTIALNTFVAKVGHDTHATVKGVAALDDKVEALAALVEQASVITDEQLERVLRKVLGSLDQ